MAPTVGKIPEEEKKRDVKRNRDGREEGEGERERERRKHVERKEECTRGCEIKLFGLYIKH